MKASVQQGSVLGHFPYLLYTHDIPIRLWTELQYHLNIIEDWRKNGIFEITSLNTNTCGCL